MRIIVAGMALMCATQVSAAEGKSLLKRKEITQDAIDLSLPALAARMGLCHLYGDYWYFDLKDSRFLVDVKNGTLVADILLMNSRDPDGYDQ